MTANPRTDHTDAKRRQLLDAAERIYYRQRDLGLTVRRLAAEAETTSQTIYTYFGSRDAVIDAMYQRATADMESFFDRAMQRLSATGEDGDPTALAELLDGYRSYCRRWPTRFLMLTSASGPDGTDRGSLESLRKRFFELVAEAMGPLRRGDGPAPVADVLLTVTAVNGFVQAELDGFVETEDQGDRAFGHLAATLVGGAP
ncbi:MAG: TetR/AcrR family transcriptional regulator [Acidimicrobiales bacterium]